MKTIITFVFAILLAAPAAAQDKERRPLPPNYTVTVTVDATVKVEAPPNELAILAQASREQGKLLERGRACVGNLIYDKEVREYCEKLAEKDKDLGETQAKAARDAQKLQFFDCLRLGLCPGSYSYGGGFYRTVGTGSWFGGAAFTARYNQPSGVPAQPAGATATSGAYNAPTTPPPSSTRPNTQVVQRGRR